VPALQPTGNFPFALPNYIRVMSRIPKDRGLESDKEYGMCSGSTSEECPVCVEM
jgi:hypothetical protein